MSTDPREIGTLIAVLLKARNLPNKRHIGKQDPYCVVEFNGRKYNTKVIKRGGQHPEWDEEIRFTLYELDADDTTPETTQGRAPPPPPKKAKGVPNVQGGTFMKISCYAQDVKEPDFIGETHVDLTEVLTKGETDEWFTLTNKDRYCGEVYLELTFWSNEPAPVKKAPVKAKARKQYGGPGTFTAHPDARGSSESLGGSPSRWSPSGVSAMKTGGSSNTWRHSFTDVDIRPEALPRSLRSSSSIAQIGLYRPNYENTGTHSSAHSSHSTQQSASSVSSLTDELGQMNLRRRLSLPQITHTELVRGTTSSASTNWSQPSSVGYSHASYSSHSDNGSTYNYDGPDSQSGSVSLAQHRTGGPSLYQPPYEPVSRASSVYSTHPQSQPSRGPRHSLPSSSSGFVPISTSASAAFPAPTPAPQMHMYQTPPVSTSPGAPIYRHTSVPPSNITQAIPTTMYAPPSGPPPGVQPFRPPTTAPSAASYPPAVSQTPAPPSPFSSISQQLAGSAHPLPQTMSYQSLPQSQSLYSYHPYPTSSSISSNQYSQSSTPPSAASVGSNVSYHSVFQQNPPSFQQQQNQSRPPPPPSPASVPPPPAVRHNQSQPHSLPQVPPPPPLGQMQVYGRSAPTDRAPSQMSAGPSHISVNVPPPPPLNPSPSQSHMSRPLPEVPQGGTSPMKRSGTMSMALSHAVGGGSLSVQPSVAYPSYNQIPPPPPLTTPSNMTSGHHSPPISVPPPPPLPEDRRLTQPSAPQSQPQPQTVPALPSHHQPPKRTQSAQALYHSAMARQQAAIGATPLPPPPPIGQQQQSAYHALQQRTVPQSYAPPPMNDRPGVGPGMTTYPGPPRAPSVHPGALGSLPMPPRLAPSQSVHQQYNAVNASGWQ